MLLKGRDTSQLTKQTRAQVPTRLNFVLNLVHAEVTGRGIKVTHRSVCELLLAPGAQRSECEISVNGRRVLNISRSNARGELCDVR